MHQGLERSDARVEGKQGLEIRDHDAEGTGFREGGWAGFREGAKTLGARLELESRGDRVCEQGWG